MDFDYKYKYDLIIIHGVLQFIEKEKQSKTIELLKQWTNTNGYHIITLFTDEEPAPPDLKEIMVGVFKNEEIKDYYKDWQIKMFKNYKFHDEHENGIKHCHAANKIIVQNIAD